MLCPEVSKFPHPKVVSSRKENVDVSEVAKTVNMNNFYHSVVITCPDEINIPASIEDSVCLDNEYYKIQACAVTEFLNPGFIENFINRGKLLCLSIGKPCITHNSVAINSDGVLIIHVAEYVYQCLGLEGKKRPYNFYEILVDLKNLTQLKRLKEALHKLETFDCIITWVPHEKEICPSSLAKYFCDRNLNISMCKPKTIKLSPDITEIPSLDADASDIAEWIGMLVHGADLTPKMDYVSEYSVPESQNAMHSNRVAVLHCEGFFIPDIILNVCDRLNKYVKTRDMVNYWASISVQSFNDSPWRWDFSRPSYFQSHDSSCTFFFTPNGVNIYSIGQIKYS